MLIQVHPQAEKGHYEALQNKLQQVGYNTHEVKTRDGHYIICPGKVEVDIRSLGCLPA